jgi:GSH-dependent disulfide-bond oxidoreductase
MGETGERLLYGMGSPNVRKVGLMLEELGLAYELRHVAVFAGEQFAPDFLAMNPLGKVPVLIDPGSTAPLFESNAILIYLAETYGGDLLPLAGEARHDVLRWLTVQTALVGPMLGQYNHFHLVVARGTEPYAAARYRNQSETVYRQLDQRLAERDWLAGDAYSIADIATWPWALYLEKHDFAPGDFPNMIRWRDRISERPTAQRMLARFVEEFDDRSDRFRRAATAENLDRFFNRKADGPTADFSPIVRA